MARSVSDMVLGSICAACTSYAEVMNRNLMIAQEEITTLKAGLGVVQQEVATLKTDTATLKTDTAALTVRVEALEHGGHDCQHVEGPYASLPDPDTAACGTFYWTTDTEELYYLTDEHHWIQIRCKH